MESTIMLTWYLATGVQEVEIAMSWKEIILKMKAVFTTLKGWISDDL